MAEVKVLPLNKLPRCLEKQAIARVIVDSTFPHRILCVECISRDSCENQHPNGGSRLVCREGQALTLDDFKNIRMGIHRSQDVA